MDTGEVGCKWHCRWESEEQQQCGWQRCAVHRLQKRPSSSFLTCLFICGSRDKIFVLCCLCCRTVRSRLHRHWIQNGLLRGNAKSDSNGGVTAVKPTDCRRGPGPVFCPGSSAVGAEAKYFCFFYSAAEQPGAGAGKVA